MTPRYDWTPASEPPDDNRMVLVWVKSGHMETAFYEPQLGGWSPWPYETVTDWHDTAPPGVDLVRAALDAREFVHAESSRVCARIVAVIHSGADDAQLGQAVRKIIAERQEPP